MSAPRHIAEEKANGNAMNGLPTTTKGCEAGIHSTGATIRYFLATMQHIEIKTYCFGTAIQT